MSGPHQAMDDAIRRIAGHSGAPQREPRHSSAIDDAIRSAVGHAPPAKPLAPAEPGSRLERQRAVAARHGIPAEHAQRLTGETYDELSADARGFAQDLGIEPTTEPRGHYGGGVGVGEPLPTPDLNARNIDDVIREHARSGSRGESDIRLPSPASRP